MLTWEDTYATGFPDIDIQHKVLFQVINRLGENIQANKDEEYLKETLDFLEEYIKSHFGYEEKCMHRHNCPVAIQNQMAHSQFINMYHSFRDKFDKEGTTKELMEEVHSKMEYWLSHHICQIDIRLKECAHSRKKK